MTDEDLIDDSAPAPERAAEFVKRPLKREITPNVDATESQPSTAMPVIRDLESPASERARRRSDAVDRLRHERAMRTMRRFTARGRSV